MKHYGDITKINGSEVPTVDIITGGSPCQDLSIAGGRKGLSGERSGLFMEQIRIIKEMRKKEIKNGKTNDDIRPRYMVWENVPGAFTSNNGEDFRAVLEETAKVADENAVIPRPEGKWTTSGVILADGWSIAWRVHDAQFWGVPQRRKRIALVADFGGQTAPEILFERKSVSGDSSESEGKKQGIATDVKRSIGTAISFQERGGKPGGGKGILIQNEHIGAMKTNQNQYVCSEIHAPLCATDGEKGVHSQMMKNPEENFVLCQKEEIITTSHGGYMINADNSNIAHTLQATDYKDAQCICIGNGQVHDAISPSVEVSKTLNCMDDPMKVVTCSKETYQKITGTLDCCIAKGTSNQLANNNMFVANSAIVRRLTPLECERLQGFPDNWTDIGDWIDSKGKKHKGESDAPRYKALGNSIALPFWQYLAEKMCKYIDNPEMASLFDGIGGFPLVFSRCGCKPVWASEIEEFPIAVTKIHFGNSID